MKKSKLIALLNAMNEIKEHYIALDLEIKSSQMTEQARRILVNDTIKYSTDIILKAAKCLNDK